jgi:ribosomal protein S21
MGVKVVVGEKEHIGKALFRLKKLLAREQPRYPNRREDYYLKPSEVVRRKKNNAKLIARRAEFCRRTSSSAEPD